MPLSLIPGGRHAKKKKLKTVSSLVDQLELECDPDVIPDIVEVFYNEHNVES